MGRKRKASGCQSGPAEPKGADPANARLGPINSYEDVANSEDEYWMQKDVIEFGGDEEPKNKRRKQWEVQEKVLEDSEEEVLAYDESDDDDDDVDAYDLERIQAGLKRKTRKRMLDSDEEAPGDHEDDGDEEGWHGAMRDEYYNADVIETEEAALEEEAEGLKLQQRQLAKMDEADFAFDEGEWATAGQERETKKVVTEVLKDIEITEDMGPEECYQILQARYPEFDYLVTEFEELQPQFSILQTEAEGKPAKSLAVVKYWTLGCYIASLASYFAILTSPARDDVGADKTMDPDELRDHEVMETLVSCREQWMKVKGMRPTKKAQAHIERIHSPADIDIPLDDEEETPEKPAMKKTTKGEKEALRKEKSEANVKAAKKAREAQAVQESMADLSSLLKKPKKSKKTAAPEPEPTDDHSDFGEEETMDSKYAAEKDARKKSLRFYTSEITQKANKREGATRNNMGGDVDIPYRERFRDRQSRLMAAAEKRGSASGPGADLDDNSSDDEDKAAAKKVRDVDSDDEYYDIVSGAAQKKKEEKAARYAAYEAANKKDLVVEQEEIGEDGKRNISYAIQKNRGLTPHRKKENRNPRVKKKKAYEAKKKKWKSVRPTYKGGEDKGGYQGQATGIKKGLIKVTKL